MHEASAGAIAIELYDTPDGKCFVTDFARSLDSKIENQSPDPNVDRGFDAKFHSALCRQ